MNHGFVLFNNRLNNRRVRAVGGIAMKVVIEIVRSVFVLSLTALLTSILFTGYWLFQHHSFNETANGTRVDAFAKAYSALGAEAWLRSHAWLLVDIGLLILTGLLGLLWRYCVKVRDARKEARFQQSIH